MIKKLNSNAEIIEVAEKYLYGNHVRIPISIEKGEGIYVYDKDGNKYLDFVGGIAVNGLGHNHPAVVAALKERAETVLHCCNYFYNEPAVLLAQILCENSCFDKVLYANSGAEANEALIKLARKYAKDHGHPERYTILSMKNSFHGRTLGTLAATGQYKIQQYFEPIAEGFKYAEFNNLDDVKTQLSDDVAAILVEPVQGEGGVLPATKEFLQGLRDICDERGILLLFDEVQTGCGRLGTLFAYQSFGVEPDAVSMAKALGSGVPIGAIATKGDASHTLTPGTHGSTYAGNPLVTSVALATIDTLVNGGVLDNANEVGNYLKEKLEGLKKNHPSIQVVRGKGMIWGLVLDKDGHPVVDNCFKKNLLINCTAGTVLRFVPPLITTKEEVDKMIALLDEALSECNY